MRMPISLHCKYQLRVCFQLNGLNILYLPIRLRLKKMKDEMKHDELSTQNDDTFNEVLRDFSLTQIRAETSGNGRTDFE